MFQPAPRLQNHDYFVARATEVVMAFAFFAAASFLFEPLFEAARDGGWANWGIAVPPFVCAFALSIAGMLLVVRALALYVQKAFPSLGESCWGSVIGLVISFTMSLTFAAQFYRLAVQFSGNP
jgi:hypothetical protein